MNTEVKLKSRVNQRIILGISLGMVLIALALFIFLFLGNNNNDQQEFLDESPEYLTGWPIESMSEGLFSSDPSFANVDGVEGLEMIVGRYAEPSRVEIYQNDGELLPNWPVEIQGWNIGSTIAHDIDQNGSQEILAISDQNIYVWLANGDPYPGSWPQPLSSTTIFPLSIGDIDGDNEVEIIASNNLGIVKVFEINGEMVDGWPVCIFGEVDECQQEMPGNSNTGISLVNLDDDIADEIVLGGDGFNAALPASLYALDGDGTLLSGWPVELRAEETHTPPSSADLDNDGTTDIIITAHNSYYDAINHIVAVDSQREFVYAWPQLIANTHGSAGPIQVAPTIGDLEGDGQLEIIIPGSSLDQEILLYLFRQDGSLESGWPVRIGDIDWQYSIWSSPIFIQLDDDAELEIIVGVRRVNEGDMESYIYAYNNDGNQLSGWPFNLNTDIPLNQSSMIVSDINNDNQMEIGVSTVDALHVITVPFQSSEAEQDLSWPMERHDVRRTGQLSRAKLFKYYSSAPRGTYSEIALDEIMKYQRLAGGYTAVKLLGVELAIDVSSRCASVFPYRARLQITDFDEDENPVLEQEILVGPCDRNQLVSVLKVIGTPEPRVLLKIMSD